MSSVPPGLSVVIPTRDRPREVADCLAALAGQSCAVSWEAIVVDDGSRESVAEALAHLTTRVPNLTMLRHRASRGPAAARNTGWRAARGEVIVFLDDDIVPDVGHLSRLWCALAVHSDAAGVEGPIVPASDAGRLDPLARTHRTAGGGHTGNIAYRKAALEAVGGFDEHFALAVGEDYDLYWRVRDQVGPVLFVPELNVMHPVLPRETLRQAWGRRARSRPAQLRLFLKHPARFPPAFVPERLRGPVRRLLRSPTPGRVVAYLLLGDLVQALAWRRLAWRHPMNYARWCLFLAGDVIGTILTSSALAAEHRRLVAELARGSEPGIA